MSGELFSQASVRPGEADPVAARKDAKEAWDLLDLMSRNKCGRTPLVPYGFWFLENGEIVIFNRSYCPIARKRLGAMQAEWVHPYTWIGERKTCVFLWRPGSVVSEAVERNARRVLTQFLTGDEAFA